MTGIETPSQQARSLERAIGRCTSDEPGPTLIVVGGIHGNEPAGIAAAKRVCSRLEQGGGLTRGCFFAMRGNLTALAKDPENPEKNLRYIEHDLNRMFTDSAEAQQANDSETGPEFRERDEIRSAIAEAAACARGEVYLLDLHTVSAASPPFITVADSLRARAFATRFPLPILLGVEEELPGLLMDDATRRHGIISITIEGGQHRDPRSVDTLEAVVLHALRTLVMIESRDDADAFSVVRRASQGRAGRVYDVRHLEPVRATTFKIEPGLDAFARVRAGRTIIARQGEQDSPRDVLAAESGLLFMPNHQTDIRVGDDAFFIVHRVRWFWLVLSAWLRRRTHLHGLLPRVLPGVRRHPECAGTLIVTPEIAAILRRQVFHLLGYRLVRFSAPPHAGWFSRIFGGVRTIAVAVRILLLNQQNAGHAGLPREGEWVVRRRWLDVEKTR